MLDDVRLLSLAACILASSDAELDADHEHFFPGDDLLAAWLPHALPNGNFTSQCWANCYLHVLDLFVVREFGCRAYLRYVDDLVLFADSKRRLYEWKQAIVERLARSRLLLHEREAQRAPTSRSSTSAAKAARATWSPPG